MKIRDEKHLSDREIVQAIDGELSPREKARAASHLEACWNCRTRKQELESAVGDVVRLNRLRFESQISPLAGPRALLKARLEQVADNEREPRFRWPNLPYWRLASLLAALVCVLSAGVYLGFKAWNLSRPNRNAAIITPNPTLTPGATVLLSRGEVCRGSGTNNKAVSAALERKIFKEYGLRMRKVSAYEVDYLITPALGGADDIRNLWPESKDASPWNAAVKDALEEHLRKLVCDGRIDLTVAQREMAADWIEAYKKYFHTDHPLNQYR